MVKRESDEVKLPQIVRPNSTVNGPEQTPLPPPSAHGPPQSHIEEHRRHMAYDNGPVPQMYRQPTYPPPPPTPLSHQGPPQSPYEQTQMYAPPPMGPDGSYPIAYPSAGGKRKSQRASQACDSCRQLKAKCDENKPCKNCLDKGMACNYRDPAPKQQDKATQDILDAVQKMLKSERREILSEIAGLHSEIRELRSEKRVGSAHSSRPPTNGFGTGMPRAASPAQMATDSAETVTSSPGAPPPSYLPDPEAAAKRMRLLETEEETEEPPGEPIRPQEAPFPHDHTTPAGRLLRWPSIRDMVRPLLKAEGVQWIDNYPQRFEESRGQLPLFGRGEASVTRPAERETVYEYVDIADDTSQAGDHQSPSAGTDWGPIGGMSPPGGGLPADIRNHVSRTDGALDFDDSKVWRYVHNYKEHIQNMHPLIPPDDLNAMVVSFLEEVGAQKSKTQAKFISQPDGSYIDGDRKRKRSPAPNGMEVGPAPKRQKPQRSIKHALVLLVLALGKICGVRDRKLSEAPEKDREYVPNHGSPVVRNGQVTSPTHGSPPSSAISQSPGQAGLPSPKDMERPAASRRSSAQAGIFGPTSAATPAPPKKNYEVIPGLEYFAYASDILGNQFGGYKLNHVQAHILASLYYGQLGRVVPSFRHIRFACQVIVDKLQPAMERLHRHGAAGTSHRDNKYLVAFWSCCQLESDILAELNLLPSGILQYEGLLPYPNMTLLHEDMGFPVEVMNSYGAQLFLRKRMNEISGQLYNPKHNLNLETRMSITNDFQATLDDQKLWAGNYAFNEDDPPAQDILTARYRAKFWGANVINYRPYVEDIMGWSHATKHPEEYREKAYTSLSVPSDATTPSDIPDFVIKLAERGVKAIMKSTEAFHGLKDKRFIITNVFGTAHAQWGNLITLAAAYQDPFLSRIIDEGHLRHLFKKTIEFFEIVAQDSSSLAIDLRILKGLLNDLPRKNQLQFRGNSFPFLPPMAPPMSDQGYMSNGATPRASGPSPYTNTNTPSDTQMDFS
ncbi:unnamed protein product [Discula destructiva]